MQQRAVSERFIWMCYSCKARHQKTLYLMWICLLTRDIYLAQASLARLATCHLRCYEKILMANLLMFGRVVSMKIDSTECFYVKGVEPWRNVHHNLCCVVNTLGNEVLLLVCRTEYKWLKSYAGLIRYIYHFRADQRTIVQWNWTITCWLQQQTDTVGQLQRQ